MIIFVRELYFQDYVSSFLISEILKPSVVHPGKSVLPEPAKSHESQVRSVADNRSPQIAIIMQF